MEEKYFKKKTLNRALFPPAILIPVQSYTHKIWRRRERKFKPLLNTSIIEVYSCFSQIFFRLSFSFVHFCQKTQNQIFHYNVVHIYTSSLRSHLIWIFIFFSPCLWISPQNINYLQRRMQIGVSREEEEVKRKKNWILCFQKSCWQETMRCVVLLSQI